MLSPQAAAVSFVLGDAGRFAACLPDAELTEHLGGNRYRGRIRITLGLVRLSFEGLARITERDEHARRLRVTGAGAGSGSNRARADIRLRADPVSEGIELKADTAVYLSGLIAQFGRPPLPGTSADGGSTSLFRPSRRLSAASGRRSRGGRMPCGWPYEESERAFIASSPPGPAKSPTGVRCGGRIVAAGSPGVREVPEIPMT
jgi:carbon monoxide dehydrogenase subunit G